MSEVVFIAVIIFLVFGLVVFRGAPYVPTHKKSIQNALDMLNLKPDELIVDLGSGDGSFIKVAANHGLRAVGFEINPILFLVSVIRCWAHRNKITVKLRDFWISDLPPDTKAVFVFLAGPYMAKFSRKMQAQANKLGHSIYVISNGFKIPSIHPKKAKNGLYLYEFLPKKP